MNFVNQAVDNNDKLTDFGFANIPKGDKSDQVKAIFNSVANKYDLMNDLMSMGIHRLWKDFVVASSRVKAGNKVLDLAAGTGDLSKRFSRLVGEDGEVVMTDINAQMLAVGRDKMIDGGYSSNMQFLEVNAEQLPFADSSFDCVTIAFGLRNVTDKAKVLVEAERVLIPGGCMQILEFSKPVLPILQTLYDQFSFNIIPKLGQWIVSDATSYQYLVESIRRHPEQEPLRQMLVDAGFYLSYYCNLSGGIVAMHTGVKRF